MSGGVPGRGARLLMYMQQVIIEKSTIDKKQMGGFVLDLVKAFNCIPRRPLRRMMNNMGISYEIIDFWLGSLERLTRLPQVGKHLGEPISSTCGVPEGDALSVCAMISLAYHYHEYIIYQVQNVRVSIYADNWSWLTSSQKANFKTLRKTLEFVSALRMQIDFTKSWAWSNATEFRKTLKDMENLFPDGRTKIMVAQHSKELGVLVKYSRQVALGPLTHRVNGAKHKLQKIAWMAIPIEVKAKLVQGAVWPFAFFGVEATGLGETHFRKLRRGVTNVIAAGHKQASAWLATHFLYPNLQDPLFYVLLRCLSILRNLADSRYLMALEVVQIAANIEVKQPYGPGTALGSYIRRAGWDISACGNVSCQALPLKCVNCLKSSTQEIKQVLMEFWSCTVMTNSHHRKGIPNDLIFHRSNTLKALQNICDEDVRGLVLNITGGFQSGVTKSWCYNQTENENLEICQFCGAMDTKTHRLLECPFYSSIRKEHSEAVHILTEKFPLWIWHPISYRHPEAHFHDMVMHTKNMPEIPDIHYTDNDQQLVFFTDGACCDAMDPEARRAGFSIIQDVSKGDEQKIRALEKYSKDGKIPDCFQVVSASHTPGMQTPARSELCAVALLLQSLDSHKVQVPVFIYTDASYVIKAVRHAENEDLDHGAYKRPNNDLVQILINRWKTNYYNIVKVKAHEVIRPDEKLQDAWVKLGNCVADQVAKAILTREHNLVKKLALEIRNHNIQQVQDLKKVYSYLIAYNKISILATKQEFLQQDGQADVLPGGQKTCMVQPSNRNQDNEKKSAVKILYAWKVDNYQPCPALSLTEESAGCMSWGVQSACEVLAWCQTLKWPPKGIPSKDDFGITYLELLGNFLVTTGKQVPITISKKNGMTEFCDVNDSKAVIQSNRARSATAQAVVLNAILQQLATYVQHEIIPVSKLFRVPSLMRLGYSQMRGKTGYKQRPEMWNNALTLQVLEEFLQQGGNPGQDQMKIPNKYLTLARKVEIPYVIMEQPRPWKVDSNQRVFKKMHEIKKS